jgi:DNA polymerase sigma
MIRTYVQLDDRVRPLAKIIKYWTKRRLLNDAGKHSHYCELVILN